MLGNVIFIFLTLIVPIAVLVYFNKFIQPNLPKRNIDFELAKCESPIERRLYNALKFRGHIVRCQERCGSYRIDLVLPLYKLAIECDGKEFHSTPEQLKHDRKKDSYLKRNGWRVIRITGKEINGQMKLVMSRIEKRIEKIQNH